MEKFALGKKERKKKRKKERRKEREKVPRFVEFLSLARGRFGGVRRGQRLPPSVAERAQKSGPRG